MKYRIYPLLAGHFSVSFNLKGHRQFPEIDNIPSYIFLVIDENGCATVVDTGFDINNIPGIDSYGEFNRTGTIPDLLKQAGFEPENIKKVILTHLHWDHTAGIKHFPEAEIYLQSSEFNHLFNMKKNEEISFNPVHWMDRLDSFILLDGNASILPGIELIRTGSHTPGHQAVKIQCEVNTVMLIGDLPFSYEWLWTHIPDSYWKKFRELKAEKFYWADKLLPDFKKWYKNHKSMVHKKFTHLTMKDLQGMADLLVFSHEKNLAGKKYL